MAVTKLLKKPEGKSLHALTTAALVLPGLISSGVHAAEGDEVDFQYSHYTEGNRDIAVATNQASDVTGGPVIAGIKSFNPIEVDSLHGRAKVSLTDRVKFAFNYLQDTWGGATPFATTPFLATGNSATYKSDNKVISGATPYATTGAGLGNVAVDAKGNLVFPTEDIDPVSGLTLYKKDVRLTHAMAMASPETRKQGDFKLSYDWDNAAVTMGGGISIEDDYDSRFGSLGGRFDFNQKRTTLNVDLSYTNSYTHATLDHDDYTRHVLLPETEYTRIDGKPMIRGTKEDWATHLGLTQVLNKDALLSVDFSYTRSTGYQSNPYKGVAILSIDKSQNLNDTGNLQDAIYSSSINVYSEKRPELRNSYGLGGRYVQYLEPLDAALHFDYRFSADDWGIQAHTFDADWVQPLGNGWTITPRIRYYSQDAADFYTPYLKTDQPVTFEGLKGSDGKLYKLEIDPVTSNVIYKDEQGNLLPASVKLSEENGSKPSIKNNLPAAYSSDQRLSGYGTLSGGVTVSKQFGKGLTLESGFEYYTHQGGLKIGGGGEGSYADFDYWVANAALKVNLDALALRFNKSGGHEHASHIHQHGNHAPAGVMFDHMLPNAGDFMVGYRFMWGNQQGQIQNGDSTVSDNSIGQSGCGGDPCYLVPSDMSMSMHMLDLMYAPTDWLTLMLMPQFTDMHMGMRPLAGVTAADVAKNPTAGNAVGHFTHHSQNPHETGGIGDLGMYALFKVFDDGTHHVHATVGLSAPTGDVTLQKRRAHTVDGGYHDYGMQLGSGTWDFKPSVTYTGHIDRLSWGAQANGVVRMEDHNQSGYHLGDMFQGTAWGSYGLTHWLTASVRGVYTWQGKVEHQFNGSAGGQFVDHVDSKTTVQQAPQYDEFGNSLLDANGNQITKDVLVTENTSVNSSILKFSPSDYPQNYGGRFWDVGFGLSATVPSGDLAGNRLSVEWLQPVYTDFNGYQLDRQGALSATWSLMF